ncbi:unnamed protein product [Acanthoscelides obtectus]|uniref:Uncharacterized protein n=1 Tax=Acanthoscelides obtectus TaxID=200917 RepID=A0A9P0NTJ5_ACAOB|nr:unnamed protein product [Acanthoscelides obtectus]CAK1628994.1 hypothetical protein AOBTE_LOCUS5517 [Acanthoscelides obtectus]
MEYIRNQRVVLQWEEDVVVFYITLLLWLWLMAALRYYSSR